MSNVSARLRKKFSAQKKLVSFEEIKETATQSENILETIKTPDQLKDNDPLHAIHITVQNLVSVFSEQISIFPELKTYRKDLIKAEDTYIPGFPPLSPITVSFFTMWAFYDYCFGKDDECIGSVLIDLSEKLKLPHDWVLVVESQWQSRMGIYEHCGFHGDKIVLKELITAEETVCICPAGYKGEKNELWYVRILNSPMNLLNYSVAFTTPYILQGNSNQQWIEFFQRNDIEPSDSDVMRKLQTFMKRGKSKFYWPEFIMDGYNGYKKECIFLKGIPDQPETLPHGRSHMN